MATDDVAVTFADVISPMSVGQFCADIWERSPLFSRCDKVSTLIDLRTTKYLISSVMTLTADWIQLVKESRPLEPRTYTTKNGFVDLKRVEDAMESGYTVQLAKMQKRWPPIGVLCRHVEAEMVSRGVLLSRHVGSHLYATPENGTGLAPHYDNHSVIVLQLAGHKSWRVFEATSNPVDRQRGALNGIGPVWAERTLKPGDVLYIPRGWPHQATGAKGTSIHITLDLFPCTWLDVVNESFNAGDEARETVPAGVPNGELRDLVNIDAIRPALLSALTTDALVRAARSLMLRFVSTLEVLPDDQLTGPQAHAAEDSVFVRREGAVAYVDIEGGRVRLVFPGSALSAPAVAEGILRYIASHYRFSIEELPHDIGSEAIRGLLDRLVREGFLNMSPRQVLYADSVEAGT